MSAAASRLALSLAVERLEQAHARARESLATQIAKDKRFGWIDATTDLQPEDMKDNNGRFVLLESLMTIVAAQTVLARD